LTESISDTEKYLFDPRIPFLKKFEEVFRFQYKKSTVYRTFLNALGYTDKPLFNPENIPLLPVRAVKSGTILPDGFTATLTFSSSGTTSMKRSRHGIAKPEMYKKAISTEFYSHFPKKEVIVLGLLSEYEGNRKSSLFRRVRYLVNKDSSGLSGFIQNGNAVDRQWIDQIMLSNKKLVLFGAAFGLVDFMTQPNPFESLSPEVIETGGMKTHKREMSKEELRNRISNYFSTPLSSVHSEYGMCELHSQMYAVGSEWFTTPNWVQVSIRNAENPERECKPGEEGKIGIIDLANLYSCPFILTNDRGVMNEHGQFRVLGRWDKENMRGCNFLIDADV